MRISGARRQNRRPCMDNDKTRRAVFIDKRFQGEFILKFVLLLLVGTSVFVLAAYLVLNRRLEETYYSAHFAIKNTGEILLPTLLTLSAVFIIVLGAAAIVITLYVSHHIAGPLFAIRRYLENVARGDLDFEPKLRLKDQTTPLAESLTLALETLNSKLVALHGRAEAMRESSGKLSRRLADCSGASTECCREVGELLVREEALIREMEFFRLRSPAGEP
jgi:methyl-accepting chemotaxis protein